MQPKLVLAYSSGRVNEMKSSSARGGWVGVGWSLSLGAIHYDDGNLKYTIDLDGTSDELVDLGGGNWRTRREAFLKIVRGAAWEVWDTSGRYYRFGGTSDSAHYRKQWNGRDQYGNELWGPDVSYRWDLDLVRDPDGNALEITWTPIVEGDCSNGGPYCPPYHANAYPAE
ncbi:MAG: hypothetical protein HYY04_02000, partial [Chloroflexi bacterium]|nr:hypothetical protein [Chloroflexota bacterium]